MKKSAKLYSSLFAAIVLTAGSFVPSAKAETLEMKQIISQLQQQSESQPLTSKAFTAQTAVTEVTYKRQIQGNQLHKYVFKTNGGSFEVNALHSDNDGLDCFVYNFDTAETIDPSSTGALDLPPGTYVLVVINNTNGALDYEYKVNGPFSEQPDLTMPSLQVTSPTANDVRLAKGSSKVFLFSGKSDSNNLSIGSITDEINITSPGVFQQNVPLRNGFNQFTLTASVNSGNAVMAFYSINLPGISRLQGKDRYEVSSNISKELRLIGGNNSGTVIIAKGDVFSDALSGGPLAYSEDAPILLTASQGLPESVIEQIKQLKPERAIILGGTGSVSTNVEAQLKSLGVAGIERIGGKDRFAVAASVGERVSDTMESDTAIIASGEVFPDALSASSIAGPIGMPVLLVNSGVVPDAIQTFIKNHPNIENFIVVGGPATVKDSVITQIKSLHAGAYVGRISGKDRYEVSINVAKYGIENFGMDLSTAAFARGDLFPDALSGAAIANYFMAPILLTTTNSLEPQVGSFLTEHSSEINNFYIFGGTGSVSQNTENQLNNLIK